MPEAVVTMVVMGALIGPPGPIETLLTALEEVESGHDTNAVGDGGRSRGCLQITRECWEDARTKWSYDRDVWDRWKSWEVARRYWKRYCPRELETGRLMVLARVWNGGPRGHHRSRTLRYWERVKKCLGLK